MFITLWVIERAEKDIIQGNIRIIVRMDAPGMMDGMGLWPLHQIAQPLWSFDVAVLKNPQKGGAQNDQCGRFGGKPSHDDQTKAPQKGKTDHVHRAKVKCPKTVHPLRTVVHLVKDFPEQIRSVHGAVPQVQSKLIDHDSHKSAPIGTQSRKIQQLVGGQVDVPQHGQVGRQEEEHRKGNHSLEFPILDSRQFTSRENGLPKHEGHINAEHDE